MDKHIAINIVEQIEGKIALLDNPRSIGEALKGKLADYWKYRIGDYRVICQIFDKELTILMVAIGDRKDVYD